jgi:N-acyl-phosphatidylethanolamine-hydrolysing phospholipase D
MRFYSVRPKNNPTHFLSIRTNEHHSPNGGFRNPPSWKSHVEHTASSFFTEALPEWDRTTKFPTLPTQPVTWDLVRNPTAVLQALFIGHATFFVQICGIHVVTDPFFSERASPFQWSGPLRYSKPACSIEELPRIDVILLSHNHYDHLDNGSVTRLLSKADSDATPLTWCVPLGLDSILERMGVPPTSIRTLDWWDSTIVNLEDRHLSVTAVPAQHNSARYPWDRNASLWCGFSTVASVDNSASSSSFYFSGDTGYRAVKKGVAAFSEEEDKSPRCPAFSEIGTRCGPFDLALLPIGAYSPRSFMSSIHASPSDAVEMFIDVKAKAAIGMHWGSLPLTDEPTLQPVQWLTKAVARKGDVASNFIALQPGSLWPHAKAFQVKSD